MLPASNGSGSKSMAWYICQKQSACLRYWQDSPCAVNGSANLRVSIQRSQEGLSACILANLAITQHVSASCSRVPLCRTAQLPDKYPSHCVIRLDFFKWDCSMNMPIWCPSISLTMWVLLVGMPLMTTSPFAQLADLQDTQAMLVPISVKLVSRCRSKLAYNQNILNA